MLENRLPFLLSLVLLFCLWKEVQGRCSSCPNNGCPQTGMSQGKCYHARYYRTSYKTSYYVTTYYQGTSQGSSTYGCGGWWRRRRCTRYHTNYHQLSRSSVKYRTGYRSNRACDAYCCTGYRKDSNGRCLVDCGTPRYLSNGQRRYTSTTVGSRVTYTCNTGYLRTAGSSSRTCQSNHQWSGTHPICTRSCGTPNSLSNGQRHYSSIIVGSRVTYTCNSGYLRTAGSSSRTCQSNGLWSGSHPTCTPSCGTPRFLSNGQRHYSGITVGYTVTYTCNTGYRMTAGSSSRTCQSYGLWSGSHPTCTRYSNGDVRLVGGSTSGQGRIEIWYNSQWNTVCDDSWDISDAIVVCRQLGYRGAVTAHLSAHFGQGSGQILLDDLQCTGREGSLLECSHNGINSHNCWHGEDASVTCTTSSVWSGSLRLTNGNAFTEGRVEIWYSNQWYTVCDDFWSDADASVVCRQLGYEGTAFAHQSAHFGSGSGGILLDDLLCNGTELSLFQCPHGGLYNHNCGHSEDAGVTCRNNGQVQLVGGNKTGQGRVEIWYNSQWNTVCDDFWDNRDANVVCRQLGYRGAVTAHRSAHFGQGSGQILLDDLQCTGREGSLLECSHNGINNHNCAHYEDASVTCIASNYSIGSVRLVNGSAANEGRVEIWYSDQWHTVCDDSWSIADATVACRQLGYQEAAYAHQRAYFGQGSGEILLDNLNCNGTERALFWCAHNGLYGHNCWHGEDAGVTCVNNGSVRLVGGSTSGQGRVEIWYNSQWNTVCDDFWDISDANVVCRQLGYQEAVTAHQSAHFGQGSGQILLDNLQCTGREASLLECSHRGINNHDCGHGEDASVTCSASIYSNGYVRLVNGTVANRGRVEIWYFEQWHTVCDDAWDANDATVVCRQLGYHGTAIAHQSAYFGRGYGEILLDNLICNGTEASLLHCAHSGLYVHNCGHYEDAGVTCFP